MSYPVLARQEGSAPRVQWVPPVHALITLDQEGMIADCDAEAGRLFGYRPVELHGRHISFLLPELARMPVFRDNAVNPRLAFLCHCGKHFTGCRREGWSFPVELFINRVEATTQQPLLLMVRAAGPGTAADVSAQKEVFMDG
jgi:PAS domain S-box-containing protein